MTTSRVVGIGESLHRSDRLPTAHFLPDTCSSPEVDFKVLSGAHASLQVDFKVLSGAHASLRSTSKWFDPGSAEPWHSCALLSLVPVPVQLP